VIWRKRLLGDVGCRVSILKTVEEAAFRSIAQERVEQISSRSLLPLVNSLLSPYLPWLHIGTASLP
jgi:hypothetical protein